MTVFPIILAGGSGTRLWPVSRPDRPKQFLPLFGGQSLLARTLARHAGREGFGDPWIVCHRSHRKAVADDLAAAGVPAGRILLEPVPRNTAPAIAVAAMALLREQADPVLLVLPSDHLVEADEAYHSAIAAGVAAARAGRLVTFGIAPTHPETGYGYIAAGAPVGADGAFEVDRFVEKPPADVAARMIVDGGHHWNAGFFALHARTFLSELATCAPDVLTAAAAALADPRRDGAVIHLDEATFSKAPDISIDHALFERTRRAAVVPVASRWSDVGSWRAFFEASERDSNGCVRIGNVLAIDTRESLVIGENGRVVTIGIEGLAVIATKDAVLVCPLDRSQDVKTAVALLAKETAEGAAQEDEARPRARLPENGDRAATATNGKRQNRAPINK